MTVLILADDLDPSADAVVVELDKRDVPAVRINTEWFPVQMQLDAEFQSGRWTGELVTPRHRVALGEVRSVWWRSPNTFRFPKGLTGPERQHAHTEAKLGLGGVLFSLPVLWVDRPDLAATAAYKPLQLAVAADAGLLVPATLITNSQQAMRRFAHRHGEVVTKMLGSPAIHEAGGRRVAYTECLTDDHLTDLGGLEHTAHQFQQWVAKEHEARVIAVADSVFAVAIHAHSAAARVDWRSDYTALSYEVVDPPATVIAGIGRVMRSLGLRYGAFDFVVGPDQEWYFLEINPGGQYRWLEEQVHVPVTPALADLLETGNP